MVHIIGLIVDDDYFMLKIITKFFEKHGIDTITAKNGSQAVDILLSKKIRFILTDVHMPVMNGNELIRFIQRKFPTLPVFVMSGDAHCLDTDTMNSECVKKIFQKPFNLQDLKETILTIITE
jgi:DNA-binding NtrC family response regulator